MRDRWPVKQLPLAAKPMLEAARQFVHAPETCQRLPELALLAGAIVSHVAATHAAIPTGFRDRQPRPTPGRLRRVLARLPFHKRSYSRRPARKSSGHGPRAQGILRSTTASDR